MTQNESPISANCASSYQNNKAFCIDAILNTARHPEGADAALRTLPAKSADFYPNQEGGQLQQQQQHQQPEQAAQEALLADYYQRYYQAQQQPAGSQRDPNQAAAAAAATALANSVAMRQLQSFMGGRPLGLQQQGGVSALGRALLAASGQQQQAPFELGESAPERQSASANSTRSAQSPAGSPSCGPAGPHLTAGFAHASGLAQFPLDWLANAGLLYQQHQQQQQHALHPHFGAQHAAGFEAACARGAGLRESGQQQQQQLKMQQQRQASPNDFVQPIRHHVVMSPNTIASAAFAGKSSLILEAISALS